MLTWLLVGGVVVVLLGLTWLGDRRRRGGPGTLDRDADSGRRRAQEIGGFNHHRHEGTGGGPGAF